MVSAPVAGGLAVHGHGSTLGANTNPRASPATASTGMHASNGKSKNPPLNSNGYHPPKPQIPLSAMTSAPLDLSSVERRGQPTACKEPIKKKQRPHGLEEAPTFRPTEEEWKEPFEYIQKISAEGRKYGICKIIPPDQWNPDFAIDTEVCNGWEAGATVGRMGLTS